jgi:hypothetical protein
MGTWLNNDKLYRKFGTTQATPATAGEYRLDGPEHMIEIQLDLTTLTQTETIQSDTVFFPKNARITKVEVVTHTAAATGTAIDVGLIRSTDRTTEIDYDGFLAAFPAGSMDAPGETTTLYEATTYNGALIGTTTATYSGHISASRTDATAFTAGVIYVRIFYYMV